MCAQAIHGDSAQSKMAPEPYEDDQVSNRFQQRWLIGIPGSTAPSRLPCNFALHIMDSKVPSSGDFGEHHSLWIVPWLCTLAKATPLSRAEE